MLKRCLLLVGTSPRSRWSWLFTQPGGLQGLLAFPAEPGGFVLCGPRLCALFSGASATWVPLCWEPRSITGGKTRLWLTLYSKPSTWGQSMFADECRPLQTQLRPFQIKGDGILQATFPSMPRADNHWLEVGICCVLRVNPRKTCLPFTKSEETTGKLSVCVCVCVCTLICVRLFVIP